MTDLFSPLSFVRGPAWKNRFMLAPLTNTQSHPDGRLSDEEFDWLVHRADGGFGMVMTCAAHVQRTGQGFPGQLGVFSDDHLPGLTRLATALRERGAVSSVQLHHAGLRSPKELIGKAPVGPSRDAETGTVALSDGEVEALIEDFVAAAVRAERAGFDGVELHGAHGYILCAFLSPETNRRQDRWGGSPENRARIVWEIVRGVRARTRPDFQLGLRLSPERFGLVFEDMLALSSDLMVSGHLDYLDMSLWSVFRPPVDPAFAHRRLIDWYADLPRGETRLGVAGKLMSGQDVRVVLEAGVDFPIIGRAAILAADFPDRILADPAYRSPPLPVSPDHLHRERLSPRFVDYMRSSFKGFVTDDAKEDA
jgi:2,4-dienoyl-CoA reductase-like NADH-dependent reductase (Old Yellow Enzyme family)